MTMPWLHLMRILRPNWTQFQDRRFWAVQALVVALAAFHVIVEALEWVPHGGIFYFLPEAFFLIPVGYAALNFGLHGSLATGLWCTVLALPNILIFHRGVELAGTVLQLVILNAVAVFVGHRVEEETSARQMADSACRALQVSESRYRGLFEHAADGILVYQSDGRILEANAAAALLFDRSPGHLQGLMLHHLVGAEAATTLLGSGETVPSAGEGPSLVVERRDGTRVYIGPVCTTFSGPGGEPLIQASLRDMTEQNRRRQELRTYAAGILRAQEEERRRIAQDMHDQTLQSMVVLCRHLDVIEQSIAVLQPSSSVRTVAATRHARNIAEDVMADLRTFTRNLRPPALDDLGVATCIRRLLADVSARSGLDGRLTVLGVERRLGADAELGLFRITQESVHNVERHAGASQLHITLRFAADAVHLLVHDNGVGFNARTLATAVDGNRSLGLLGMQERAALLGGRLSIQSNPGDGTRITATIPG